MIVTFRCKSGREKPAMDISEFWTLFSEVIPW